MASVGHRGDFAAADVGRREAVLMERDVVREVVASVPDESECVAHVKATIMPLFAQWLRDRRDQE